MVFDLCTLIWRPVNFINPIDMYDGNKNMQKQTQAISLLKITAAK